MNTKQINLLPNLLDNNIVEIIHKKLLQCPRWLVATNNVNINLFQKGENATDSGLILCSYENNDRDFKFSPDSNEDPIFRQLNFYGDLILDLCLQKCTDDLGFDRLPVFKNVQVIRYFWNYYHNTSKGTVHVDSDEDNHWSIILYLNHCPEGGTVIADRDGNQTTVPHVPGNAVIFPASMKHYGLSPNPTNHRCCLNILFKAHRMKNVVNVGKEILSYKELEND